PRRLFCFQARSAGKGRSQKEKLSVRGARHKTRRCPRSFAATLRGFTFCLTDPSAQLHALRMADAILRIVSLFQLLEARIIFCAVISRWPVFESKVRIVCVMACDPGLRTMSAHPTYRF